MLWRPFFLVCCIGALIVSFLFSTIMFYSITGLQPMIHWLYPLKILFYLIVACFFILPLVLILFNPFKNNVTCRNMAYILIGLGLVLNLCVWFLLNNTSHEFDGSPVLLLSGIMGQNGYDLSLDSGIGRDLIVYTTNEEVLELKLRNINTNETSNFMDSTKKRKHVFEFKNLSPNTEYEYYFENDRFSGGKFKTLELRNNSLVVGFASDFHFGGHSTVIEDDISILKLIANESDYFIFGGDLTENGYDEEDWALYLNKAAEVIQDTSSVYLPGNHDTMFGGDDYFTRYFVGNNQISYYTIDFIKTTPLSSCHHYKLNEYTDLIVLDMGWGEGEDTSLQQQCLIYELYYSGNVPNDNWVIIASHSFFLSSGSSLLGKMWDDQEADTLFPFVSAFTNYGVDFVLSGHNHHLEYMQMDNLSYIIGGGSGSKKDPEPESINEFSKWHLSNNSGYVELILFNRTNAQIIFKDISGNQLYSENVTNLKARAIYPSQSTPSQ